MSSMRCSVIRSRRPVHRADRRLARALLACALAAGGCVDRNASDESWRLRIMVGRSIDVASADGVSVAVSVEGFHPPALVFIHGWSEDRSYWAAQIEAFLAEHRVVALDLAGHGASGTDRRNWTIEAFAADVRSVVNELNLGSAILIGHSLGAAVALEAARSMPGRVRAVVLVDAYQDLSQPAGEGETLRAIEQLRSDFVGRCPEFARGWIGAQSDTGLVFRITQDLCSANPAIAVPVLESFASYDPVPALAALEIPVLAIEPGAPPTALEANRLRVGSYDARILSGAGHFPMLARPVEFNLALAELLAGLEVAGDGGSP